MTTQSNGRWARRFMYTAGAAALMLASAGAATAQQATGTQASDAPVSTVDEVVVVGTRSSLQSAMNRKRSASTVSDSIVADDIGQFPDKNVGEALGRVTGVQLSRDFGEGNAVSIRGVEPDLNRVEINGVSVLSTAGNLNVYGGGGRSNDFRELPAEIVKSIDVFKGFTADMTEGAIGGTVSVQTRKPLDFRKPTFSMTLAGQKLDTLPDWKPRASLFGATQLLDGRLGLMANVTYDNVLTRGDFYDDHSWARLGDFDNSPDKTVTFYNPTYSRAVNDYFAGINSEAACATITTPDASLMTTTAARTACQSQWYDYNPRIPRYRVWTRDDERTSGEFTAEYKFTDNLRGFVTYQTNKRTQQLNDINYGTDFTSLDRLNYTGANCSRVNAATAQNVPGVVVDANHNVIKYTVGNCVNTAGRGGEGAFSISSRDFRSESTSEYITYGLKWHSDRFKVDFLGANAKTDTLNETNNVSVGFNTPGLVVSLEPGTSAPTFTFAQGYSPSDLSAVSQYQIQYRPSQQGAKEDQYKLDVDFDPRTTFLTNIKFGGRYSRSENKGYDYGGFIIDPGANLSSEIDNIVLYSNSINSTARVDPLILPTNPFPYQTNYWSTTQVWSRAFSNSVFADAMTPLPSDFHYGGGSLPANWLYPNFNAVAQHLDTSHFNLDNLYSGVANDGKTYNQIPSGMNEKTDAQYVRLDWALPIFGLDLVGNLGLRRVHTQTQTFGKFIRNETRLVGGSAATAVVSNTLVEQTREYTKWLPSFNVNAWLIDNVLSMRVGYAQLMARPLYNFLVPNMTCTINYANDSTAEDGPDSCSAGNPDLKPYEAAQYDLSFEWYPNRDTQFSAGFFYKDIQSFYVPARTNLGLRDVFGDGVLYSYNSYINGKGAKISGIELTAKTAFTFLPGLLSGFGADVNYTYQEASDVGVFSQLDGSPLPYPGLSSNSYNATLWYERGPINARLAYNYRSEYLVTAADQSGNPVIKEPTGYLDGKISWKPGLKGLTLFAEGKNLTEEDESTYAGDIRLINRGYSGRRFFLGATYKY
ncbi:catecholate siderophore receptor CirA [Brevundimonas sp. SH203]|nr:catecholate siderophore receptor CirA [Brevundimonas sp. SH203]